MNKFKKLGVSALAGSLAAFSAQAAELSFSGDSSVSYTSGSQTATASAAQGVSADVECLSLQAEKWTTVGQ